LATELAFSNRSEDVHSIKIDTGLFEMIIGVLTTCHTQYT